MQSMKERIERLLLKVQKPARYIGGEVGSVVKDKSKVDVRFAFCFPDTYEVGMSHLGMKILYGLVNREPDSVCERFFMPWTDMMALMEQEDVPLFSMESRRALCDFDMIGFTLQYETTSYKTAQKILESLCESRDRCLVGDIRCNITETGTTTVNAAATFYETMVGGTPDAGLPTDSAAVNE